MKTKFVRPRTPLTPELLEHVPTEECRDLARALGMSGEGLKADLMKRISKSDRLVTLQLILDIPVSRKDGTEGIVNLAEVKPPSPGDRKKAEEKKDPPKDPEKKPSGKKKGSSSKKSAGKK